MADFLDKLPKKKFNFRRVVTQYEDGCGTVCCAIGWLPKVFPRKWGWGINPWSVMDIFDKSQGYYSGHSGTMAFFNLSLGQYAYLFLPNYNSKSLSVNTTAKIVARRIRKFVKERD